MDLMFAAEQYAQAQAAAVAAAQYYANAAMSAATGAPPQPPPGTTGALVVNQNPVAFATAPTPPVLSAIPNPFIITQQPEKPSNSRFV